MVKELFLIIKKHTSSSLYFWLSIQLSQTKPNTSLFEQKNFQEILDRAQREEVHQRSQMLPILLRRPISSGPIFRLLVWCEGLSPSLSGDAGFTSIMGQPYVALDVLRMPRRYSSWTGSTSSKPFCETISQIY